MVRGQRRSDPKDQLLTPCGEVAQRACCPIPFPGEESGSPVFTPVTVQPSRRQITAAERSVIQAGEAGGVLGAIYLRKMDGSPPVRLGDGTATSLSTDSKWVLSVPGQVGSQFVFLPTGTGAPRTLAPTQINFQWSNLLPNGHQILFAGNEPGHGARIYLQDVPDGKLRPITSEGVALATYTHAVSPDGRFFLAVESDGSSTTRSVETGDRNPIPGLNPGEVAVGWTGNGKSVYVYQPSVPARVYQVERASGRRQLWRELNPSDPAGVNFIRPPHVSADGKAYAYNYNRILSDLYLVDGLH